ncbi:hypothetical protein ACLQ2N_21895 [Streptomyces sp. DT224]|uniref:hypothetical protein n=1 Tax=Streptomyces sp. DT224 TaxID=3393426 RepID=UPI003CF63AB8
MGGAQHELLGRVTAAPRDVEREAAAPMRWRGPTLNAFGITFDGRLSAARQ